MKKSNWKRRIGWCIVSCVCIFCFVKNSLALELNFPILIAHAGGALDGKTYLNSLEAVQEAIKNDFTYIELDLLETTDGDLVAAHDWKKFHNLTGFPEQTQPISAAEIKKRKILEKQTILTSEEIRSIFEKNKNLVLVTDKIQNIDFALLSHRNTSSVGLKEPFDVGIFEGPCDGVPMASVGVALLVDAELVSVDLEFGGGHDPMGVYVVGVGGVDFDGVGGVFELEVQGDDAVAALLGGEGARVFAACGEFFASPRVAVANLVVVDVEIGLHNGIDGKVQRDEAVAAILGLKGMVIVAGGVDALAVEVISATLADFRESV